MNEPQKLSMSTGEPVVEKINKQPLPSIYPENTTDDVYANENSNEKNFWDFIAKYKAARANYENNKEGDQT